MRRKGLWVVLLMVIVLAMPVYAEGSVTIAGTSLGFEPLFNLTESNEFPGYASAENQLYVMAFEVPKMNNLKTMDDFEKLISSNETAEMTVVSKERNMVEGVNSYLVQYTFQQEGLDIAQWVLVLEGEKKFGQIVVSTIKTFAEEHQDELLTMMKSFHWTEQVNPVLSYTLTLPEEWSFIEGDEELAVFARKDDQLDDPNTPFIFVINFKAPVEEELREGFIQDFFMHEETKKLVTAESLTIDSQEATLYFIEDTKEDGQKVINLVCVVYTQEAAYGIMAVQSEVITPEFFKTAIHSWKLLQ